MHLGGTRLLRILPATMDGRQGADWVELAGCGRVMPIHYDDYTVCRSPLSDFEAETRRRGLAGRVHAVERGAALPL